MTSRGDNSTLSAVVLEAIRARMVETHTALPGIVEAFHVERQTVDLRIPLRRHVRDADGVETLRDWPKLAEVPVWAPHSGGYHITLPVAAGDECLVIFAERDLSGWLSLGDTTPPQTKRQHDLSDAIALVGFNSQPNRVPGYSETDLTISRDGGGQSIVLKENGEVELTATITRVNGDLEVTGGTSLGAVVTANGKDISDTHEHSAGLSLLGDGGPVVGNCTGKTGAPV